MTGYLVNFTVYTMAMLGLIFFALMVYKKFAAGSSFSKISKNKTLSIEETISIAPRKTLYVVKAGEERFLIAGDVDKTTLISKLGAEGTPVKNFNDEVSNNCLDQHVSKQKTKPLVETSSKVVNFTKNKTSKKSLKTITAEDISTDELLKM